MNRAVKILVVDDSVLYRKIVSNVLEKIDGVEVVGTAPDGEIALRKIGMLRPDLLTLDLEMPNVDGLGVLAALQKQPNAPGVIMLSAFTSKGAETTMSALQRGAFDFVLKPTGGAPEKTASQLRESLETKIEAYARSGKLKPAIGTTPTAPHTKQAAPGLSIANKTTDKTPAFEPTSMKPSGMKPRILAIGVSTGGPQALSTLIPSLPADLPVPVVIVQHMPPLFTKSLAEGIDNKAALTVVEAADGDKLQAGCVYIAPGGSQLKIDPKGVDFVAKLTDDPPENSCKPAVDYMLRSLSQCIAPQTLAIIMTGMGSDGTLGCKLLKRKGATVVAQDKESCVVYGMPRAVVEAGLADRIVPLNELASTILALLHQGALACK